MNQRNLYAPPKARVVEMRDDECSKDGKFVIVPIGSDLPPRCIKCNEPAEEPVKEIKLYWHSPWLYLLILLNILIYAVVGLIVRSTVRVSPGLCEAHAMQRRRKIFIFLSLATGCCIGGIGAMQMKAPEAAAFLFLAMLVSLVIALVASRKVYAKKITKEYARLGGCKEAFLASLD